MSDETNRWDLPKQTRFKDWTAPDNKLAGDCWRCCIAAVIGLPADAVPHFLQDDIDSRERDDWKDCDDRTQAWLNERGFVLVRVNGRNLHFDYLKTDRVPVIKCGPTPRSQRMHQHHAVVYLGNEMVYDPHPSNAGLTAVCDQYLIIKQR